MAIKWRGTYRLLQCGLHWEHEEGVYLGDVSPRCQQCDLEDSEGHMMGLSFPSCIYVINTGSGTEPLLLQGTEDDLHVHPSLCVGKGCELDTCWC